MPNPLEIPGDDSLINQNAISISYDFSKSFWNGIAPRKYGVKEFINFQWFLEASRIELTSSEAGYSALALAQWKNVIGTAPGHPNTPQPPQTLVIVYKAALLDFADPLGVVHPAAYGITVPSSDELYVSRVDLVINESNKDIALNTSNGFFVLVHEFGHLMGLDDMTLSEDLTFQQTIMIGNVGLSDMKAVGPMALDIAAVQKVYGVSSQNSESGTKYDKASFASAQYEFTSTGSLQTIWDAGGSHDTFDLSAFGGVAVDIDLRPAIDQNGTWLDHPTKVGSSIVYIALGSHIEDAIGNDQDNVIFGNNPIAATTIGNAIYQGFDGANKLVGGPGNDKLCGLGGSDILIGGPGDDIMIGGRDQDGSDVDVADYSDRQGLGKGHYIVERPENWAQNVPGLGQETDVIIGIERIVGTNASDTARIQLLSGSRISVSTAPSFRDLSTEKTQQAAHLNADEDIRSAVLTIDMGDGNDTINVSGGANRYLSVFGGAGSDTLNVAIEGAQISGGDGADIFSLAKNILIADANVEDRISYMGSVLNGGIRWANSELQWAAGRVAGIFYGTNSDNELVIRNRALDDQTTFVANFNSDVSGVNRTAGILVGQVSLGGYRLTEAPKGYIYSTFETLLGPVLKALTGQSYFKGVDPLALDLDGDGLELNARTGVAPHFDIDGDGFAEQSGWVRGDDGFLVRDLNGNGRIDSVDEMFGREGVGGFTSLRALDSNLDGKISALDTAFASLRIWKDTNGNAVTDAGELLTLTAAGVQSINLTPTSTTRQTIAGNEIAATGAFTRTNGTTGVIADINFAVNQRDTVWLGDKTIDSAAAGLPEVKGFGTLTDLRIAVTDSAVLKSTLQGALPSLNTPDLAALRAAVTPVLTAWANAVPVPAGTPGTAPHVDVAIRVGTTPTSGAQVYDFAFRTSDALGSFYKLGSGAAVKDSTGLVIARPTFADVLGQTSTQGSWTVFSGAQIQFLERYMGNALPIGQDNLSGASVVSAASTLITEMWETLNQLAVRVAIQGPLAPYFDGVRYNATSNHFEATTERQLVPTFEAILRSAPTGAAGAQAHLQAWKPVLDIVLQDFDRGHDYLQVSYGFLFQSLVAAYENVPIAATLVQAAAALDITSDLIRIGTGTVEGTNDADLFYLGTGNQTVKGGVGPDTYAVGRNFGHDVIQDVEPALQNSPDMLRFAHLKATDITLRRDGLDLVINVKSGTDELRIVGQFQGQRSAPGVGAIDPDYGVQEIVFVDGVVWDRLDIAKAVTFNTPGNDTIVGTDTIDFLDGGTGDDNLSGAGEGDLYVFGVGSGKDTITDSIGYIFVDSPDIVKFKAGVLRDAVQFSRNGSSEDLIVTIDGTSDQVTVKGQFSATYTGPYGVQWMTRIEAFSFEDGQSVLWNEIFGIVLSHSKTSGNDIIYGFSVEDTLDGGAGNDYLSGGNESDTYIFGLGYGNDTIEDKKTNILSGGTETLRLVGVSPNQVTFSRVGSSADLLITLSDGSTALIKGQFSLTVGIGIYEFNRIERFEFDDGSVLGWADVVDRLLAQYASAGDDELWGFEVLDDTMIGGLGNDTLHGLSGSDTYVHAQGDGNDIVDEPKFMGTDKLVLTGPALTSTNLRVGRSADLVNAILTFEGASDRLTLLGEFWDPYHESGVESIAFSDGVTLNIFELEARYLASVSTPGNDEIYGFDNANDTITGGSGNDILRGLSGGDTYLYAQGDGSDIIDEPKFLGTDSLKLTGPALTSTNLKVGRTDDLHSAILSFGGISETITLLGEYWDPYHESGVETVVFSDGVTLDIFALEARYLLDASTAGDDVIYGFENANDTIAGGRGNDMLYGLSGGDTYLFSQGDGIETIIDPKFMGVDTLRLTGSALTSSNVRVGRTDDLLSAILTFGGVADTINLISEYGDPYHETGVEKVVFSDGITLDIFALEARYLESVSTPGDDIIYGFESANDTITGGRGNDVIFGLSGNDTYLYTQGDGNDTIHDPKFMGSDTLKLTGPLLASTNLRVGRTPDMLSAILTFNGVSDTITLEGEFGDPYHETGVEKVIFSNGVTLDIFALEARYLASVSTPGNDDIYGFDNANDTITGGLGNDTMHGLTGGDTYIHVQGDGNDTIDEPKFFGTDTLRLAGADLTSAKVVISRSADLSAAVLTFSGAADSVTLRDEFTDPTHEAGVETIVFSDAVTWNIPTLQTKYLAQALSSSDLITGFEGRDDTIIGGPGNDQLVGLSGNDTLVGGDGDDVLIGGAGNDVMTGSAGTDVFRFSRSGNGSDTVADFAVGDLLRVDGSNLTPASFVSSSTGLGLNKVHVSSAGGVTTVLVGTDAAAGADVAIQLQGTFAADAFTATGTDIRLSAVNRAPTGTPTGTLPPGLEDIPYPVGASVLLQGFGDPDGDTLSVADLRADHGVIGSTGFGAWTFTPAANYNGPVLLSYNVVDGRGGSVAASLGFTLAAVNDAPVGTATGALPTGTEDIPYLLSKASLIFGFSDADGDELTVLDLTATHGTLSDVGGGNWTFVPAPNYFGSVALTYKVIDGHGGSIPASQSILLEAANDAPALVHPIASQQARQGSAFAYIIPADAFADVDAGDVLAYTATRSNGSPLPQWLSFNPLTRAFGGTPARDDVGDLSIRVTATDGALASASADFALAVSATNAAPTGTATATLLAGTEDVPYRITPQSLLAGFSDPENDQLSVVGLVADHGLTTNNQDGSWTIVPAANYNGLVGLNYAVIDGRGGSVPAIQSFALAPVNDPAIVGSADVTVPETNVPIAAAGVLSIVDVDSPANFIAQPGTAGRYGTFTIAANGTWTYKANLAFDYLNPGESLSDSFQVMSADGTPSNVSVTISGTAESGLVRLGDAPVTQTGTGGQWEQAWTQAGFGLWHKGDYASSTEDWTAVKFNAVSAQLLSGGDVYAGDLGVSGQSAATSSVRQEVDGSEALRVTLPTEADGVTIKLSRLFSGDDASTFNESGLIRLLDAGGRVVAEKAFVADSAGGTKTVTLAAVGGFVSIELLAGAYNAAGTFVHGAYSTATGAFGGPVSTDAAGKHGSDFLLDAVEFSVPLIGVTAALETGSLAFGG